MNFVEKHYKIGRNVLIIDKRDGAYAFAEITDHIGSKAIRVRFNDGTLQDVKNGSLDRDGKDLAATDRFLGQIVCQVEEAGISIDAALDELSAKVSAAYFDSLVDACGGLEAVKDAVARDLK